MITLELPPLRERPEDIEPLARHFLAKTASKTRRPLKGITEEALSALREYHWPGNVRELENIIERGAILARGDRITLDLLPLKLSSRSARPADPGEGPLMSLRDAERQTVIRALRETAWNKSQAATLLGVTRKTLDRKIKDFDLSPADLEEHP